MYLHAYTQVLVYICIRVHLHRDVYMDIFFHANTYIVLSRRLRGMSWGQHCHHAPGGRPWPGCFLSALRAPFPPPPDQGVLLRFCFHFWLGELRFREVKVVTGSHPPGWRTWDLKHSMPEPHNGRGRSPCPWTAVLPSPLPLFYFLRSTCVSNEPVFPHFPTVRPTKEGLVPGCLLRV